MSRRAIATEHAPGAIGTYSQAVEADGTVGYVWTCENLGQEPDYEAIVAHCAQ